MKVACVGITYNQEDFNFFHLMSTGEKKFHCVKIFLLKTFHRVSDVYSYPSLTLLLTSSCSTVVHPAFSTLRYVTIFAYYSLIATNPFPNEKAGERLVSSSRVKIIHDRRKIIHIFLHNKIIKFCALFLCQFIVSLEEVG